MKFYFHKKNPIFETQDKYSYYSSIMERTYIKLFLSILLSLSFSFYKLHAQIYPDHFGTGNDIGVTVTSSGEQGTNAANHTLTGTGLAGWQLSRMKK